MKNFFKKTSNKLALVVVFSILIIEGILLVFSYQAEKEELYGLRARLQKDVMEKAGKNWDELHPGILDIPDIERRLDEYALNIILLTILITFLVSVSFLASYHFIIGKKIKMITKKNHDYVDPIIPENLISNDDIGDLIRARNVQIKLLKDYQSNIEEQLESAKLSLVQAAKMSAMGEFTSMIIHDLKNPLSVSLILSDQLKNKPEKYKDYQKVIDAAEKINNSSKKINDLITKMGKFTRKEKTKIPNTNINEIIENALDFTKTKIQKEKVEIVKELKIETLISADPIGIEQILNNLINNAIDAMEGAASKKLSIQSYEDDESIYFSIEDSGMGIPKENLENIFGSFFTTKSSGKGTGLGLSSAQMIVEDHHGKISVESEVGKFTRFKICLPKRLSDQQQLSEAS